MGDLVDFLLARSDVEFGEDRLDHREGGANGELEVDVLADQAGLRVGGHVVADDLREDVLLVVEVVVDGRPRDLGGFGDVTHRGLGKAPAGEQPAARLEDLRSRAGLPAPRTGHAWPRWR